MAGGVEGAVWGYFGAVCEDHAVFVRVVVATVGEEFGHVVNVRVAAAQGVAGVCVVDADEEGFLALVRHFGRRFWDLDHGRMGLDDVK